MKKLNVIFELIKMVVAFLLGSMLWIFIFAFMPGESVAENEPFAGAVVVFGIATGLIVVLATKFNAMQKAFQNTKSTRSNIRIYEEKEKKLLDKANRIAEKYMNYEEKVQTKITKIRSKNVKIHSSKQFLAQLENYPELKANVSIMELLKQIQECENSLENIESFFML